MLPPRKALTWESKGEESSYVRSLRTYIIKKTPLESEVRKLAL
jgi:hypothetical protein